MSRLGHDADPPANGGNRFGRSGGLESDAVSSDAVNSNGDQCSSGKSRGVKNRGVRSRGAKCGGEENDTGKAPAGGSLCCVEGGERWNQVE
jgi:hypothetical protein